MGKIKCPNPECGVENEDGLYFCDKCSTELIGGVLISEAEPGDAVSAEQAPPVIKPPEAVRAKLVVKRTGRVGHEFVIDQESVNIGRWDPNSGVFTDIDLSDDDPGRYISRSHARISLNNGEYFIQDMGSTNGTFVNKGPRLTMGSTQKLENGDEIIMGRTFFTFVVG
jgi:hypothetical protein